MEIEVRAAQPGEEEAILPAFEWLLVPPGRRPVPWEGKRAAVALRKAIESHDAAVLLAEAADGELVGICTAYQDIHSVRFGYRAWVEDLAVHPGHRSEGIGARLLAAAREWARERGATHMKLDTGEARADAQRFYDRLRPDHRGISYTWEL